MAGPSQDFVRAVTLSFDVTADAALRSAATASLEQLRQSEDGWLYCLQAFGTAQEEPVKFWCLQTLVNMVVQQRRYAALPDQQKQTLRQAVVSWLQSRGAPQTDEPASVKNKFAQLFVRTARGPPRASLASPRSAATAAAAGCCARLPFFLCGGGWSAG